MQLFVSLYKVAPFAKRIIILYMCNFDVSYLCGNFPSIDVQAYMCVSSHIIEVHDIIYIGWVSYVMLVGAFMLPKTITFQLAFEVRNLIFHNDKGFTYIQKSIKVRNTMRNVSSK